MNEKVQDFLDKSADKKNLQKQNYYYLVMSHAKLLTDTKQFVEVSSKEYLNYTSVDPASKKTIDGHFYISKYVPIEVTDEEFKAIEEAIDPDTLYNLKLQANGVDLEHGEGTSNAALFLIILGWVLIIGGIIVSYSAGNISTTESGLYRTYTSTKFDFTVFISSFIVYLVSGAFCFCAAELFKKLQTIVNLLKRK